MCHEKEKKKRFFHDRIIIEEKDGMNLNYNIGRNARPAGCWHVPRISRRVNLVKSFLVYIGGKGVSESIRALSQKYSFHTC